jgi:hypothetical protein
MTLSFMVSSPLTLARSCCQEQAHAAWAEMRGRYRLGAGWRIRASNTNIRANRSLTVKFQHAGPFSILHRKLNTLGGLEWNGLLESDLDDLDRQKHIAEAGLKPCGLRRDRCAANRNLGFEVQPLRG